MDKVLQKMATTLNGYDEASLMNLWQKYAMQVHEFEPTKRWEQATLVLCLIQAVQWKNKLFNHHLLHQTKGQGGQPVPAPEPTLPSATLFGGGNNAAAPAKPASKKRPKAVVLSFPQKP